MLTRGDDYRAAGKPVCGWDDPVEHSEFVDALARDGHACLRVLDGRDLDGAVADAAALLATVLGRDLEADDDGRFVIARRVAEGRVISTVDRTLLAISRESPVGAASSDRRHLGDDHQNTTTRTERPDALALAGAPAVPPGSTRWNVDRRRQNVHTARAAD